MTENMYGRNGQTVVRYLVSKVKFHENVRKDKLEMSKGNGFLGEFKKFILRGNVMDMAVGVIVGGAFTAIVTSLNQDILTPLIGLFGGTDFSHLVVKMGEGEEAPVRQY